MFMHYFDALEALKAVSPTAGWTDAFAAAYQSHPHTFIFGLLTAMLAVQLIGLGIMALQNMHYFEELFDLGSQAGRTRLRVSKR
jgi:hypothetical protein